MHWFTLHAKGWNIRILPSLRIRVAPTRVRVPDISILSPDQPKEQVPTYPPLAIFEVLAPEDNMDRMMVKFADFAAMGVPEIWLVDPETAQFSRYGEGILVRATHFGSPGDRTYFKLSKIEQCLD